MRELFVEDMDKYYYWEDDCFCMEEECPALMVEGGIYDMFLAEDRQELDVCEVCLQPREYCVC